MIKYNVSNPHNEWHTPRPYIEAAEDVMGGRIDLDPASCALANETVRAERFYSIEDDGLGQPWLAQRLWLNPPYGKIAHNRSSLGLWVARLVQEFHAGNVVQAVVLTTSDPDERWFQPLWDYAICFTVPRVTFFRPGKKPERQSFGTAFTYLGPYEQRFIDRFRQYGPIAKRIV